MKIKLMARETPGDARFRTRWEEVGELTERDDFGILVVDQRVIVDGEFMKRYPQTVIIASATTGHTHLQFNPKQWGVEIVSLRGERDFLTQVKSVAEFCLGMMLRFSRPLNEYGHTLNGKALGIVGLGRIGTHLAQMAGALGMTIRSVDKDTAEWAWEALFEKSDFVSLHLPEEPSTYGRVSAQYLNLMKPAAYLINTARASVLDEGALQKVLHDQRLAGAALDVTDLRWEHFPNVIVTPHIAGSTLEDRIKTDEFLAAKVKALVGRWSPATSH